MAIFSQHPWFALQCVRGAGAGYRSARREFDIECWSVDRLGRSLQDLVAFLTELHALEDHLYLHQQGVDTTTPGGKAEAHSRRTRPRTAAM